jgi:hypothetical protein
MPFLDPRYGTRSRGLVPVAFDFIFSLVEYEGFSGSNANLDVWDVSPCMGPHSAGGESTDEYCTSMLYWLQGFKVS